MNKTSSLDTNVNKNTESVILRTVPRMIVPTLISSNLMIFWRVSGAGKSSRGSRPGFVRASKISLTVKTPAFNLVANLSISTNLILALSKSNLFLSAKSSRENPNSAKFAQQEDMIQDVQAYYQVGK